VDTLTYSISDGKGGVSNATVSITVTGANDAPTAQSDEYRVDEDSRLVVSGRGVLENDSDSDTGDTLAIATYNVTSALGAPVLVNSDGTFTYDPTGVSLVQALGPGQTLRDSFRYAVTDGTAQSGEAVVNVTVEGRNDAPVPQNDNYTIEEEGRLIVSIPDGVLKNDTDPEGSPLNATRLSGPSNGILAFNSAGSFTYTPNANFAGSDTFEYRASDGSAGTTATVTISVTNINDAPVATADTYEVTQDATLTVNAANGLLRNDTDVDQELLRVERVTGSGPNNGTLTLSDDGAFVYRPQAGFVGSDSFQYRTIDGIGTASAAVTVTLNVTNTRLWRNPEIALDVNDDSSVSPIDVLLIVNYLNENGAGPVPVPTPPTTFFRDTNGDNNVTPADALMVINHLNSQTGAGEGESAFSSSASSVELAGLFADSNSTIVLPYLESERTGDHRVQAALRPEPVGRDSEALVAGTLPWTKCWMICWPTNPKPTRRSMKPSWRCSEISKDHPVNNVHKWRTTIPAGTDSLSWKWIEQESTEITEVFSVSTVTSVLRKDLVMHHRLLSYIKLLAMPLLGLIIHFQTLKLADGLSRSIVSGANLA
jgi:VCBS repeat-containing protein